MEEALERAGLVEPPESAAAAASAAPASASLSDDLAIVPASAPKALPSPLNLLSSMEDSSSISPILLARVKLSGGAMPPMAPVPTPPSEDSVDGGSGGVNLGVAVGVPVGVVEGVTAAKSAAALTSVFSSVETVPARVIPKSAIFASKLPVTSTLGDFRSRCMIGGLAECR